MSPTETAGYRIAVTTLDQDSAEVLMEIVDLVPATDEPVRRFARAVVDHWRYAQAATIASGSIEVQRILMARALVETR